VTARTLPLDDRLQRYVAAHGVRETTLQRELRRITQRMPRASMQIGAVQGALLQVLVRATGARRCLEIGTFTGYSALAVALALPRDGRIVCCDVSEEWTAIARRYWKRAGVAAKVDLRIAPALETLAALLKQGKAGKFDFAFIDADKANYANYYERCLKLVRRGGLIAVDNTLWGGSVVDRRNRTVDTRAIRAFNRKLIRDRRVDIALVPVGDGLSLAVRR
jgi:predicted O-methyltransferase YrrM